MGKLHQSLLSNKISNQLFTGLILYTEWNNGKLSNINVFICKRFGKLITSLVSDGIRFNR